MTSMTYGTLPTRDEFDAAFDAETDGTYRVDLNSRDGDILDWIDVDVDVNGTWDADDAWAVLTALVACWQSGDEYAGEYAGDVASAILATLGFEWV